MRLPAGGRQGSGKRAVGRPDGWAAAARVAAGAALAMLASPPGTTHAQRLAPLAPDTVAMVPGPVPRPWVFAGLPAQKFPATRYTFEGPPASPVLRIESEGSYGNLLHRLDTAGAGVLSWRWRVERALERADLRTRQGDDVALKVCALFDLPLDRVPFVERQLLRLAELRTGESLPTATVCYVWDPSWPSGSVVPNAYTRRVRYLVLGTRGSGWESVRRDLANDFVLAFGDESTTVPRLRAIAVGADADNTGGRSLAFLTDLQLSEAPTR